MDNSKNDTFLSRVFGLHSVYNQIHDNYRYYDPDAELQEFRDTSPRNDIPTEGNSGTANTTRRKLDNPLDSESDLDLSLSLSSPPSPTPFSGNGIDENDQNNHDQGINRDGDEEQNLGQGSTYSGQVHWDTDSRQNWQDQDFDDDITSQRLINEDDTSNPLKNTARNFINKIGHTKKEDMLPLFNRPQVFHKPSTSIRPSEQTLFQQQRGRRNRFVIPPKERALYLWANIVNMDDFLTDIYYYYRGKGIINIVLTRLVDLIILVFILVFTVFLKWGIDYKFFYEWQSEKNVTLKDLIVPNFLSKAVPFPVKFLLFGFLCYIILRLIQLYFEYNYKLREIKNFYLQLLNITDDNELTTISWITIVERLMQLRDYNTLTSTNTNVTTQFVNDLSSKVRLNAHDIANRIMRKENYMIALINKDILDLSLSIPAPFILNLFLSSKSVLTKTLEWNLKLCINNFVFNQHGQINLEILKDANRNRLANDLSSRFKMAAIINLILCPFIVIYFVLLYFFRYFNEYKSNPSSLIGLRQYTPLAEWKLREFNELPHFFTRRLHLSIGPANTYINQFPQGFLVINLKNLINFVSGSITAVLVIMGLWFDNEERNFWSFEITENKSTLFYISLFGTLWAITSSNIVSGNPNSLENMNTQASSFVYDPEASLRYVSQFTHYLPRAWNGRLHTVHVKNEFCELYPLKIIIIINEILSLILTPFILWFKVLNSSGAIVDFFREYSIHVDGLGYVCYFAMFNFEEKDKNMMLDLQKGKGKGHKRRKSSRNKQNTTTDNTTNIELNGVKSKKKEKAKISDLDLSSDSSDDSEANVMNDYYHDDKMIKSYMYFLESYGGANAGGKGNEKLIYANPPNSKFQNGTSNKKALEPLSSINPPNSGSLNDSSYNLKYDIDDEYDDDQAGKMHRSGMLGMINQFYRHDKNR